MSSEGIHADANVEEWITAIIDGTRICTVPDDYGLYKIAEHLGKCQAVALYWKGAEKEEIGDIPGAMSLYQRAFRIWPALDTTHQAGLPSGVRKEAEAAAFFSCGLLSVVSVVDARASQVVHAPALLTASDLRDIDAVWKSMTAIETPLVNNPQNAAHEFKVCTFLNNPPIYAMRMNAPHILSKLLRFGEKAWDESNWSGDQNNPGPLYAMSDGITSLSIRVAEHWEYAVGGGLVDPLHYDVDSVLTLVALLSDENDFEGGIFRTHEENDSYLDHQMTLGSVICFISHKYHNVAPVTKGIRRSFVMELWQGGQGHMGR